MAESTSKEHVEAITNYLAKTMAKKQTASITLEEETATRTSILKKAMLELANCLEKATITESDAIE